MWFQIRGFREFERYFIVIDPIMLFLLVDFPFLELLPWGVLFNKLDRVLVRVSG
jgi:hypothetical protein